MTFIIVDKANKAHKKACNRKVDGLRTQAIPHKSSALITRCIIHGI